MQNMQIAITGHIAGSHNTPGLSPISVAVGPPPPVTATSTKVLVTGANGFIGTHLVKTLLAQGDDVTCLVRKTSDIERLESLGASIKYADVTDAESLQSPLRNKQVVYHVAGCTMTLRRRQFYDVNQMGTRNIAQLCARQANPPTLIYVSSLAAVGPAIDGKPRTEADPPVQVSHYGRSKWAGEGEVAKFADRVPTTIIRPPIVLGEADRMGLEMFKSVWRYRVHVIPGFRNPRFSLIHADDLVRLMALAASRGTRIQPDDLEGSRSAAGHYFAACEQHPTYAELGRMIARAMDRRVLPLPLLKPVVWTVATTTEAVSQVIRRPLYLNLDKAHEVTAGSWLCSSQAAIEQLGFSVAAPLEDRLRQTAQWYRRHKWL
jgi:nucleoside-diphosphate-sugar epimerase